MAGPLYTASGETSRVDDDPSVRLRRLGQVALLEARHTDPPPDHRPVGTSKLAVSEYRSKC